MSTLASLTKDLSSHLGQLGKNDDKLSQWSSLIGIVTAIVGNILISFALNIQRYAHIRIDREYNGSRKESKRARKALPKSLRGYGTAVEQERIAEERARLNATAPGPGHGDGVAQHDRPDERTPLNKSHTSEGTTEHEHDDDNEDSEDKNEEHSRKSYLKSPYWWLGITLMAVGETGNFLAYGFAPASIVSPLGVVALISNCLIAPLMLKERFRQRDFWGVVIAIGGAVTIVFSAKTSEAKMGPDKLWHTIRRWEFLTYVCITLVFIVILMIASPRYGRRTILVDVGLVALFGGYTALSTKGVAAMLSGTLFRAFTYPITYVLVLVLASSAIMQIRYINRALSNFDSTQIIPTQFVLFTLSVIIGSAVLYRDFEKTDLQHVVRFVVGCILTFSGVWFITSGRRNESDDEDEDDYHEETIQLIDEEAISDGHSVHTKQDDSTEFHTNGGILSNTQNKADDVSVPSVSITPFTSTDTLDNNRWPTALNQTNRPVRPTTPSPGSRQPLDMENTPFYTPASGSNGVPSQPSLLVRSDSAPADPVTPTRSSRATLPEPDMQLMNNQIAETPPTGFFKSARGSIQRLVPGPFMPPLSGSLSAVVADSLLRGEGSPKHIRDSLRRQRSSRGRIKISTVGSMDAQSSTTTPTISRWATRDDDLPETPLSTLTDIDDEGQPRRRSRLGSLSDTLGGYLRRARGQSDVERDANSDDRSRNPRSNTDSV